MHPPARALVETPEFRRLLRTRQRLRASLSAILLALYFGLIALACIDPMILGMRVLGDALLGLCIALGIVVATVVLTSVYVRMSSRLDARMGGGRPS